MTNRAGDYHLLQIDLTAQDHRLIDLPTDLLLALLGGASLGARLLRAVDYSDGTLAPQSPLAVLTGPLTGTIGPAVGRFVICGRSPATDLWGESNIGGHFGPELRKAGFDGLWITGKASEPVYIWIHNGMIEVRDAERLWGLDTYESQSWIKLDVQDSGARVICIGEAGENLLRTALILGDHGRVAGRTGMGALMGSKNLKAIAVRGTGEIPIANRHAFGRLRAQINRTLRDDNVSVGMREFGTGSAADVFDYFGMMPKKYFTHSKLHDVDQVSGISMSETILSGVSTCHGCVIACGRKVRLESNKEQKGPEYETMIGFGPNLGIVDLPFITQIGDLCDRLGVDTISTSNTIGLAFLLYEEGAISDKDTDGVRLEWGATELVPQLVMKTVRREGFGAILAEGSGYLAERYGFPGWAAEVNNLEVPYHDPRGASGMALVYATSPRGACHNQGHYYLVEIGQTMEEIGVEFHPRKAGVEKVGSVVRHQDWVTVLNSLVQCIFANVPVEDVCELVSLATGSTYSLENLTLCGERGWTEKRLSNIKWGLTKKSDTLPKLLRQRYRDDPECDGGVPFEEMLDEYYRVRGWDPDSGNPTLETLKRLGIADPDLGEDKVKM